MQETANETAEDVALVQETGRAFEQIYVKFEKQAQEIDVIGQMVRILSQSSNSVAQIVQGVSVSTQQSAGSTREVAQNMEKLAGRAGQLLRSVEAFKLRDEAAYSIQELTFDNVLRKIGQ